MNLLNEPFNFSVENIAKIEELKKAKWVLDTEKPGTGGYYDLVVSIFYQEKAYEENGSHYFGLYIIPDIQAALAGVEKPGQLMITDASWIEDLKIDALEAANGDVIFSRYRHDYCVSPDGTAIIDGGRAYTRTVIGAIPRVISIKDGLIKIE